MTSFHERTLTPPVFGLVWLPLFDPQTLPATDLDPDRDQLMQKIMSAW